MARSPRTPVEGLGQKFEVEFKRAVGRYEKNLSDTVYRELHQWAKKSQSLLEDERVHFQNVAMGKVAMAGRKAALDKYNLERASGSSKRSNRRSYRQADKDRYSGGRLKKAIKGDSFIFFDGQKIRVFANQQQIHDNAPHFYRLSFGTGSGGSVERVKSMRFGRRVARHKGIDLAGIRPGAALTFMPQGVWLDQSFPTSRSAMKALRAEQKKQEDTYLPIKYGNKFYVGNNVTTNARKRSQPLAESRRRVSPQQYSQFGGYHFIEAGVSEINTKFYKELRTAMNSWQKQSKQAAKAKAKSMSR